MSEITLKIGRHEYTISGSDVFMDNRACVQLLTQSKERIEWGNRPNPVLSKRAIKEISKYDRCQMHHTYGPGVDVFTLAI